MNFSFFSINKCEIDSDNKAIICDSVAELDRETDAEVYSSAGIISRPSKNTQGFRFTIGRLSIAFAFRNYKIEAPSNDGETLLFSTDSNGEIKSKVYLDKDGKIILNDGEDFAVKYNELKKAFDILKQDFNTLVTNLNAHTHMSTAPGSPTSPASTSTPPITWTPTTADMTNAKAGEIKL